MGKRKGLLVVLCLSIALGTFQVNAENKNVRAVFPGAAPAQVLQAAEEGLGVPYVWGGTDRNGWDCSGYVTYTARKLGVDMGRNTGDIVRYCRGAGAEVTTGQSAETFNSDFNAGIIKPGDIVVFFNGAGVDVHTAIVGNGQTIYHAWYEGVGTVKTRFDEMWAADGGHGKTYASYVVYRGAEDKGRARIQKVSANAAVNSGNNCYSLAGAVYQIYSDAGCTRPAVSLTTDASGRSGDAELPAGTYYVKEITAPKGFEVDEKIYTLTVNGGQTSTLTVSDKPKTAAAEIEIFKKDAETGGGTPQGGASLQGTEFIWKYYDGFYTKENLPAAPVRAWVTQTIYEEMEDGETRCVSRLSEKYQVSGDALYQQDGKVCLPLGTVTVEEWKAPEGYLPGGTVAAEEEEKDGMYLAQITEEGESALLQAERQVTVSDKVIRGGVKIGKRDLETGQAKPHGSASLAGAEFTITTQSDNSVIVRGEVYEKGEPVMTIVTDEEGIAMTEADALPYGHYRIEETKAPEGYLTEGAAAKEFDILENGVSVDLTAPETSIYNQVKRGDIEGVKIAAGTHRRLGGVPFKITSRTTGESHIIMTDKNGNFSTASDWASHGDERGVWFGESAPEDTKGALLYDTYTIEELRCEENEGFTLIPPFDIEVSRDNYVIHLGTLTDDYQPDVPEEPEKEPEESEEGTEKAGSVRTGDHKNYMSVFILLLILSCAIIFGCVTITRKKK